MKKRNFINRIPFIIIAVLLTAFIFKNSLEPANESLRSSGRFVFGMKWFFNQIGVLKSDDEIVHIVRKTAHFCEFAAQGCFISWSFYQAFHKRITSVLFFGLLTACTDEFIQTFVDGRSGMISDVFIDFSGTIGGLIFSGLVYFLIRMAKRR